MWWTNILLCLNCFLYGLSWRPGFGAVRVANIFSFPCCPIICHYILYPCCAVRYDFRINTMFDSFFTRSCLQGGPLLMVLFVCVYWCSTFCPILWLYVLSSVVISTMNQTWGQLLSNVIDYITITLQFSWLHYITLHCDYINFQM